MHPAWLLLLRGAWSIAAVAFSAVALVGVIRPSWAAESPPASLGWTWLWVAVVCALVSFFARVKPLDLLVTTVHELAHAVAAILVGGTPVAIRVSQDVNGSHVALLPQTSGRRLIVAFSGQQGPGVLACVLAGLLSMGRDQLAVALAAGIAVFAGVLILRSKAALLGVLPLILPGAAFLLVGAQGAQGVLSVLVAVLAVGGLGAAWRDVRYYRTASAASDEAVVSSITRLPILVVVMAQLLGCSVWTAISVMYLLQSV